MIISGVAALALTGGAAPAAATSNGEGLLEIDLDDGRGGISHVHEVWDINARGDVATGVVTTDADLRVAVWRRYDRPTLIDLPYEGPVRINDRGEVLGPTALWSRGRTYRLSHPSRTVSATALNNRGQVVGTLGATDTSMSTAFLWENGRMTALATPDGMRSEAFGINDRGDIVGTVQTQEGWADNDLILWRRGVPTVIDLPPDTHMTPRDINAHGQVIGDVWDTASAYLWDGDRLVDLGALSPGRPTLARDINDAGDIVGASRLGELGYRPVLWRDGQVTTLDVPGQGWQGQAWAVNEHGDVAGSFTYLDAGIPDDDFPQAQAFLWRDGRTLTSVRHEGECDSALDMFVVGVDERGTMAGFTSEYGALDHHYIWIPVRR